MNNSQDNDTNNGSIYSKFRERLRKIKLSRIKKKKLNEEFIQNRVKEIRKELSSSTKPIIKGVSEELNEDENIELNDIVSRVIVDIKSTSDDRDYYKKSTVVSNEEDKISFSGDIANKNIDDKETERVNDIIENIKINKPKVIRTSRVGISNEEIKDLSTISKQELLREIGVDVIDKIKSSFEDKLDELEVMASELYILSQVQKNEFELNKVDGIKKRINEMIDKINLIIEQYNLYKKNYYLDNVVDIDDSVIVDDIINYRNLLDSFDDEKKFVKEYKALDEFRSLYHNLVEIKNETENIKLENEEKIEAYQIRDKKYDDIKVEMISVLDIDEKCSEEIDKQNEYFKDLMAKVSVINEEEYVTTHLRGFGNLIGQSLRYMGLMIISPFTGLIPGIAMQTIVTRRMVANAYRNLHYEDIRHIHYEAINYDSELNHHLNDIDYTQNLIMDTLNDVTRLKEDFMMIYNRHIPCYEDTLKKIDKIEQKLLHNQNKVSIVKKNLGDSKKLNEDKLRMVRQLNEAERNRVA